MPSGLRAGRTDDASLESLTKPVHVEDDLVLDPVFDAPITPADLDQLAPPRVAHSPISLAGVDFACIKVRLVIEGGGAYHEDRARPDARRDRRLADLGLTVFRVPDHLVVQVSIARTIS